MNKIFAILKNNLGPFVDEYRDKWAKAGKEGYIPEFPLHINFEINFGCNLKCDFCLYSMPKNKWKYKIDYTKNISFNKYKEIIDEGSKNNLYSVELNGINEPLLKKNIDTYIKYAHMKNILITSLHTNAMLLSEEMSDNIIDSNLKIIIFSLDAFKKETYEKIRIGSDYGIVLNNINKFIEIKKKKGKIFPLIKMSFAKNKMNFKEIDDYINYWENKVEEVSFSNFCNPFLGTKRGKDLEDKYYLSDYDISKCKEPFQRIFIRNDGNVSPCCSFFAGEFDIGNIYENSIYDIWHGEQVNKMRLEISQEKNNFFICKKCIKSVKKGI